ncbi:CAP domain-containing protein [Paramaledivibacter caminithermalis]|jgi:uncharacterized protein YkwD|uniref:Uncharacterized conserved protein YkwD, contains CAP (CSP/antigen 5/PR1) domain n=1 Tax=Paramaledivibacter caminithermalis (strain DSM 15212 / CIP 107654 / DViRD3) TaxID=1121301 RepID=A0A1M6JVA9_PARC5|nr:CAP domain-containing protein [Paramaledivibacter caminithermalis]SHJ50613.1 Uncharacterized conserved protein YkwD, contains CAP (CSP/antigen 5/PR1) domain [Paramaledivibacter caminithermalis DSM 15212]
MKKSVSKITSIAILSASLISFIPINSYGVTYYSSRNNTSSDISYSTGYSYTNNSFTRYYSKYNNTPSENANDSIQSNNTASKNETSTRSTVYLTSKDESNTSNSTSYTVSSSGRVTRYYSRNTQNNVEADNASEDKIPDDSNSQIPNDNSNTYTNSPDNSFNSDQLTMKMLILINQERTKAGIKPLILDEKLTAVAELKARDMVENDYLSHTSATYGSIYTMIKNGGIKYQNAGENIARAFSVESAHNNFMNSYIHKRAILADHFTHVGIGIEKEKGGMYKISVMFIENK